jgi:hypothetical protein
MAADDNDFDGLLDDDPALDCLLFEKMERDVENDRGGGCFSLVLLLLVPVGVLTLLVTVA